MRRKKDAKEAAEDIQRRNDERQQKMEQEKREQEMAESSKEKAGWLPLLLFLMSKTRICNPYVGGGTQHSFLKFL